MEGGGQSRYRGVLSGVLLHDILEGLRQQQRSELHTSAARAPSGPVELSRRNLISARLDDRQGAEAALELLLSGKTESLKSALKIRRREEPFKGTLKPYRGHALAARSAYRRLFAENEFVERLALAQAMELAKEQDDEQLLAYLKGLFSGSAERRNEAPPQEIIARLSKLDRETTAENVARETPPVHGETPPPRCRRRSRKP